MKRLFLFVIFTVLIPNFLGCAITKTEKKSKSIIKTQIMNIDQFILFAEQNKIQGENVKILDKYFAHDNFLKKTHSLIIIILPGLSYIKATQSNPDIKKGLVQISTEWFWEIHFMLKNDQINSFYIINSGINDNK